MTDLPTRFAWRRAALFAASMLASSGALAQTPQPAPASDDAIPDIVVTAQRRSESQQSVPIAISAFSADTLSQRGIATPLQLINYVPNLFGSNNTGLGSANAYYIRGLGNTETIASFDPPVGTYIDDIYMSRQNGNNFAFFDIDRIEVLRGPQGTLFGRNTTGGAINVVLKRPAETIGGYAEVAYGAYDKKLVRGSIDIPANEFIQTKISGYFQDDDGYVNNTTTGERLNDTDMAGLRAAVQIKWTDALTWNLSGAYMRSDGENLPNFDCDPRNPANCKGRFATTGLRSTLAPGAASPFAGTIDLVSLLGGRVVPQEVTGRKAFFALGNQVDTQIYTSNVEWAASEAFNVSFITGFIDMRQKFALDFTDGRGLPNASNPSPAVAGLPRGGFSIINDGQHRQFSQEIKATGSILGGAVDYVAGLFYLDEDNTTDFADVFGPNFLLADRILRNGATAKAGYVQADFNASDQWKLTAGIRYTDEEKTFAITDNRALCQPLLPRCLDTANMVVGAVRIPTTQRAKVWTPRFALNYIPNDDMLFFASATRGFKSGGWNARGTASNTLLPFDPERVWSYELGGKTEFFDSKLRINLTGFWLETQDLQTPSAFIDPVTGAATFITQNFADYQNRGVELEIVAVPAKGLSLYANLGYQKDKYKVGDTLSPNQYGVKAVRQQQADCRTQLAARRVPLGPTGANNAPDCAAGIVNANGEIATPVRTPDFSISFGGSYDYAIPAAGIFLTPSVNALYRTAIETGTANGTLFTGSVTAPSGAVFAANPFAGTIISGSRTPAFWQVQAALTMRTDDDNWTLSLECENCLDKGFSQSSLVNYSYLSPPRTWQVRARRAF